jgi:hypothetical protein
MEILRNWYARGAIDAATVDEMRARIEGSGTATRERQSTTV